MRRRDEVMVGILVTVGLIVGIAGTLWLARKGFGSTYPMHTRFAWGAGLKTGQQVLLAGVQIGAVDKVALRPDGFLDVRLQIEKEYTIPEGSTSKAEALGIFGDRAVSLTPPRNVTFTPMRAGDTIPAGPPAPTISDVLARVDTVGRSVTDITKAIEFELVKGGGLTDLRRSIAATNRLIESLGAIAAEQSRGLTMTMTTARRSLAAIDSTAVDSTVRNVQAATAQLAALSAELEGTKARLDSLLAKVDHGNGTVAKLLNDSTMHTDLRRVMANMDSLLVDIKKNPRRYINVRVF
jgi:phospholipid/cholesterol/gamma-HCH transport system substrate-binding protein